MPMRMSESVMVVSTMEGGATDMKEVRPILLESATAMRSWGFWMSGFLTRAASRSYPVRPSSRLMPPDFVSRRWW